MSVIMEEAEEAWSKGLSGVPDKDVCASHFEDAAIKRFIRKGQNGICDYCSKERVVIPLEDLMTFLMETVMYFYTDAVDFAPYNSAESGYLVETADGWDILTDEFGLEINNQDLFNDMESSIDYSRAWADEEGYYGTGPDLRWLSWAHFSRLVKHTVRYLFPQYQNEGEEWENGNILPSKMLLEIGRLITKYKIVKTIPTGQILFRCRQHGKSETIARAEQMCTPEIKYCLNPNRMSPAGIPMFYGAFELETTLEETLDSGWKNSNFTTVQFRTRNPLNLIDLSTLPQGPSPFDQAARKKYFELGFLRSFISDLTKPIERDQKTHIEYVPTQIVTEYFRYGYRGNINGIIYPSSRNSGKNAVVLFYDHYESKEHLEFVSSTLITKDIKMYDPFKHLGL